MRAVLITVLVAAAGFGVWWFLLRSGAQGESDLTYGYDLETGEVRPAGTAAPLVEGPAPAIGVFGQVPKPRKSIQGEDGWHFSPWQAPVDADGRITGAKLLESTRNVAPIRFRSQASWDKFASLVFESVPVSDEGETPGPQCLLDVVQEHGFEIQEMPTFLFVYERADLRDTKEAHGRGDVEDGRDHGPK